MPRSFVLPNQPTRYARSHTFKIKDTKLHLEIDYPNRAIEGRVIHSIEPIGKPIDFVELDCAELDVSSVRVNGETSQAKALADKISIPFGFDLKPGEVAKIEVEYSGHPRLGVYFRGPTKDFPERKPHIFTHGEAEDSHYYFPCYDAPNMRSASETSLTVPSNWIVISNGELVEQPKEEFGKKTWRYRQTVPHAAYLLSFVAGEYEIIEEEHDGIKLEYVVPPGKAEEAKRSFGKTPKMLDFFAKATGHKYPYPKYAQATVSEFMAGGMENITATTLTERTLHDARSHIDFTSDNLVAHELAHQWFGDWITCKDWAHAWLNEAFATYFNCLFREFDLGVDDFQYFMHTPTFENYQEELDRYQRAIVCNRYWDPDEIFDFHTYEKGATVLNALRGMLGDDVFFSGIRNYVSKHRNSVVETFDFREAMEEASGVDLEQFFDDWIYSPGFPEYLVSYTWNSENDLAELKVEQINAEKDDVPLYKTPIKLCFAFEDGSKASKRVSMSDRSTSFVFSFKKSPLNVNFDPKNWIPKKIKFQKPKEMFLYQLKNDDNSMERVRACEGLIDFPTSDVVRALGEALQEDKFWGVRVEAGRALGKIATMESGEILLSCATNKDPKVRRGVAIGLRGTAKIEDERLRERALSTLISMLENDESYFVRAYAAWSLGFYKEERAFTAMSGAINQESINDVIRYRLFLGFIERKDLRAVPLAIDVLLHGKWHLGRAGAADCLGGIGKNSPEALKALLEARSIPDHYVRKESALAIGKYGDPSAVSELKSWLNQETTGNVRRAIRESIYSLENNLEEQERSAIITGELEKLRNETAKLVAKLAENQTRSNA